MHEAPEPRYAEDLRGYDPLHPTGMDVRGIFRRIWGVLVAIVVLAVKFGFALIKFFGIFISFAAYALIWGWRFAVGFIVLLLVHEAGHYVEARRQGLHPSLPRFIPFLGAYVAIKDAPREPWRNALISLAGPVAGGLSAVACWGLAEALDSRLLLALAYSGFLLNLFNLIPFMPFDGGFIAGAARALSRAPAEYGEPGSRGRGRLVWAMYVGLAVLLALGMWKTHVPQNRL